MTQARVDRSMSPRRTTAIALHELRLIGRDPSPVLVLLVFPLILMVFLKPAFQLTLAAHGYPNANGAEQVVPGQAAANGFYIVGMTSFAFFNEYGWNTWDRLRASRASSAEIIIGKAAPHLALSVAQFLAVFVIGIPLLQLHVRGAIVALVPLVIAFGCCLVMLGVMITALCRTLQQASACAFGGLVLFGAIGGALVPIDVLPSWARAVAPFTPTYWAMRGFRSVILDGTGLRGVLLPTGVLLAMSALFLAISATRFRLGDAKASFS
jgi:ABC-2 type transport system permease protein